MRFELSDGIDGQRDLSVERLFLRTSGRAGVVEYQRASPGVTAVFRAVVQRAAVVKNDRSRCYWAGDSPFWDDFARARNMVHWAFRVDINGENAVQVRARHVAHAAVVERGVI